MKQVKLLLLFVLIFSLAFSIIACENGDANKKPEENSTVADDQVKHELHNYLVLDNEHKGYKFSEVSRYEGEIIASDSSEHLIALKTKDLDTKNYVIEKVEIYNVLTGEKLQEHSATYPLYAADNEKVNFEVEISYPVIRVTKESQNQSKIGESVYSTQYFLAKKDSPAIRTSDKGGPISRVDYGNGLVSFDMGDDIVWIDRYMNELRSVKSIALNGYDIDIFNSEYQGYLYTWDNNSLQVFNRLGVCSGVYNMEKEGCLNVHVLDNGNVLIQELEKVDVREEYDFMTNYLPGYNDGMIHQIKVNSYIMNHIDGSIKEVELDFVVAVLETAYTQKYQANNDYSYLPFELAKGHDNQAIIYRFGLGKLSLTGEYAVLTSDLKIEYVVKNTTTGVDLADAWVVSPNKYVAPVYEGGAINNYIFDLDGNVISPFTSSKTFIAKTENYFVTVNGIYDNKMNLIYEFKGSNFNAFDLRVDKANERFYVTKHNFTTGGDESYLLDVVTKNTKLVADGVKNALVYVNDGVYGLKNLDTSVITFYNLKGEVKMSLLAPTWSDISFQNFDEAVIIKTTFEGRPIIYVAK